jgi:5S rRNA maturation endonuclease (ribonuclease M5)
MVYPVARQTEAVCPLKRLGDDPRSKLGHDPGCQRRATIPKSVTKLLHRKPKTYDDFAEFLGAFLIDLNNLCSDGWSILVEGPRDARALRKLGCVGDVVTVSSVVRKGDAAFQGKKVVIMTDLDREGAVLASRYIKRLSHDGFRTSLRERQRLKNASHGVFLHVENLSRFARDEG